MLLDEPTTGVDPGATNPHGGDLRPHEPGEYVILATTATSLRSVAAALTILFLASDPRGDAQIKELLLVSFDRELALVFGRRVWVWDGSSTS